MSICRATSGTRRMPLRRTEYGKASSMRASRAGSGVRPRWSQDGLRLPWAAGPTGMEISAGFRPNLSDISPTITATGCTQGTTGTGPRPWSACMWAFRFSTSVISGAREGFHGFTAVFTWDGCLWRRTRFTTATATGEAVMRWSSPAGTFRIISVFGIMLMRTMPS